MGMLDLFRGSQEERIAKRFIKALREVGEARRMEYLPAERSIAVLDEQGVRQQLAFLGNLQREVVAAPEPEHEAIYRRYASGVVGQAQRGGERDYAGIRPTLRLILKDESYPAYIALSTMVDFPDGKRSPLVFEPVAGGIIACCVEDAPHSLHFVTENEVALWGVNAQVALADARSNVCALPCEVNAVDRAHYVFADDSFQAARLVNVELFRDRPVAGSWVAVVPDRNTFFLTASEDEEGLAGLARLAEQQLAAGERLISGMPLVMRNGRWEVFEPPKAVRLAFDNVARRFAASRWADYKAVLEKDLAARDEDIYVASLTVYEENETGVCWSMVVWSKDVDTVLTVADRVAFVDADTKQSRMALWADVLRVMGLRMEKLEGLPERYRVKVFPSAEDMIGMGTQEA